MFYVIIALVVIVYGLAVFYSPMIHTKIKQLEKIKDIDNGLRNVIDCATHISKQSKQCPYILVDKQTQPVIIKKQGD